MTNKIIKLVLIVAAVILGSTLIAAQGKWKLDFSVRILLV